MSVASLPGMITPFLILIFPMLLKKHTVVRISKICIATGIVGCVIKQFAGTNMAMILVGTFISGIGTLPLSAFLVILLADTVDYNEYKTQIRVEGVYASMGSFGQKIGIALASAMTGFLLEAAGFISSSTAVQPDSAITMIRGMFGILPALLMALIFVVLVFFDLEKKMPEVRKSWQSVKERLNRFKGKGAPFCIMLMMQGSALLVGYILGNMMQGKTDAVKYQMGNAYQNILTKSVEGFGG